MPVCRRCKLSQSLIKAHIIPEAWYPESMDGRNVGRLLWNKSGKYPKRLPKGAFDTGILCRNCDNEIGITDNKALDMLVRADKIKSIIGGRVRIYGEADPAIITEFVATLLFRAAWSTHEMFSTVTELDTNSAFRPPGPFPGFAVSIHEWDIFSPPQIGPMHSSVEGVRHLIIYANRFCFFIRVDEYPDPVSLRPYILRRGCPIISIVRPWHGSSEARWAYEAFDRQDYWRPDKPKVK